MQDYGGPVGFRIATRHPEAVEWLIVQNSNAYEEGFTSAWDGLRGALWKNRSVETEEPLLGFLTHDAIKSFYLHGAAHPELISPDNWESDYGFMQRPHSVRMNLDLFYDYRNNVVLYPLWQMFLRDRQPKTLIFWGQNDIFFTPAGGVYCPLDQKVGMAVDGPSRNHTYKGAARPLRSPAIYAELAARRHGPTDCPTRDLRGSPPARMHLMRIAYRMKLTPVSAAHRSNYATGPPRHSLSSYC